MPVHKEFDILYCVKLFYIFITVNFVMVFAFMSDKVQVNEVMHRNWCQICMIISLYLTGSVKQLLTVLHT